MWARRMEDNTDHRLQGMAKATGKPSSPAWVPEESDAGTKQGAAQAHPFVWSNHKG